MRMSPIASPFLIALVCSAAQAQPGDYSIRDAGFVDFAPNPYRLMMRAKDAEAPESQKQEASLRQQLRNSNIVLVACSPDEKNPPIPPPVNAAEPTFRLFAPDDRVVPFDPTGSLPALLESPLRKAIRLEAADALCVVVLLESDDAAANESVRAKVARVLERVNKERKDFEKVPDSPIRLLILPVKQREAERWTLWGLGEDAPAEKNPKVAVIFGKMRRAGSLFEGDGWQEDDLFERVAALAKSCEHAAVQDGIFGPPLPFSWPAEWPDRLTAVLHFNPENDAIKAEMRRLLVKELDSREPWLPQRAPRNPDTLPTVFAEPWMGLVFLVGGAVGWLVLGASVCVIQWRAQRSPSS